MTLADAPSGFKSEGQFIAALHAAKDLNVSFASLKSELTGSPRDNLSQAIHDVGARLTPRPRRRPLGRSADRHQVHQTSGQRRRRQMTRNNVHRGKRLHGACRRRARDGAERHRWQNKRHERSGNPRHGAEPQHASKFPLTTSSVASPFAWLDDGRIFPTATVSVAVSSLHWQGTGISEVDAPVTSIAAGVAPRVQIGASIPHIIGSSDPAGAVGGLGSLYLYGKVGLLGDESPIKLAVSPTIEVLSEGAALSLAPTESRAQFGLPVSVEYDAGSTRVFAGTGFFTPRHPVRGRRRVAFERPAISASPSRSATPGRRQTRSAWSPIARRSRAVQRSRSPRTCLCSGQSARRSRRRIRTGRARRSAAASACCSRRRYSSATEPSNAEGLSGLISPWPRLHRPRNVIPQYPLK